MENQSFLFLHFNSLRLSFEFSLAMKKFPGIYLSTQKVQFQVPNSVTAPHTGIFICTGIPIIEGNVPLMFTVHDTEFVYRYFDISIQSNEQIITNKFDIRYFQMKTFAFSILTLVMSTLSASATHPKPPSNQSIISDQITSHLSILSFICF